MNHRKGWNGQVVRKARAYWRTRLPYPCTKCGQPVLPTQRWQVDHIHALALGGQMGVANQGPAHKFCNESDGGKIAALRKRRYQDSDKNVRAWV